MIQKTEDSLGNKHDTRESIQRCRKRPINIIRHKIVFWLILCVIAMMCMIEKIKNDGNIKLQIKQRLLRVDEKDNGLQIQKLLAQRCQRPKDKIQKNPTNHKFKPTPQAYFAFSLYMHPNDKRLQQAELLYYSKKYNISFNHTSATFDCPTPINHQLCIVSTGRNLMFQNRYMDYIDSIQRQKYINYTVVYIDDASTDHTPEHLKNYISSKPTIRSKIKIVSSSDGNRKYALYNHNTAIIDYCSPSSIIVQLDPDDCFLGTLAFSFINYIYSAYPDAWVFYTNYVRWNWDMGEPSEGISSKISMKLLLQNKYRHSATWITSATKTFRRQLYLHIDKNDFIDGDGYYRWASDLFIHYSLVELAGPSHYKFVNEIFYYYHLTHNPYQSLDKKRDKYRSLMVKPYLPLKQLTDPISFTRDTSNEVPQYLVDELKQIESKIY